MISNPTVLVVDDTALNVDNKLDGYGQHRREGGGVVAIREIIWNLLFIAGQERSDIGVIRE